MRHQPTILKGRSGAGRTALLLAIALGVAAPAARAGLEIRYDGIEVATPSAIIIEPATPGPNQRRQPGETLRCWNNGRLVYESSGFRARTERSAPGLAMPRVVAGPPVRVFDMRDGMCILSTH